jgi:hypothetical protein
MKLFLLSVLIVVCDICIGQTYVAEAELAPVDKEGFYNISLTPDKSQYLNSSFTNIRILDDNNKEVPYLLRADVPHMVTEVFREYSKIEKKQTKNCCTTVVLHNPDQRLSNNVRLVIKNADVTKEAMLLGSDDKVNWFALNQHLILTPASNKKETSEIKIVNFPLSNYQYYSLQIDDSTSAPLNIVTAGYFEVQREEGKYAEVSHKEITRTDSVKEKTTYLHVRFNGSQTIDKCELTMKGAPFFLRKAMVHVPKTRSLKGGKTEKYYYPIQEIEITSKRPATIELLALKVNELLITVDNEDNPSLEVDSFKAYQLKRHLTAWLNAGTKYIVRVGPPELGAPVYDISFFKGSVPDNPAEIQMGAMIFYTVEQPASTNTIFTTKAYIWAAVIAVIVILGFMSVRLLHESGSADKK